MTRWSVGQRILIVDGNPASRAELAKYMTRHGYEVAEADSGLAAVDACTAYDLVIVSLELPDMDGLYVCRSVAECGVPIIVTAERKSELDCVLALQAGADDYIAKPYHFRELAARVEALMWRRSARVRRAEPALEHGPLRIDALAREVTVFGRRIALTRKEFDLLVLLAENSGRVVPRAEIMRAVWGHNWSRRTADTHVSSLRAKLGASEWIISVRGVGFKLVSDAYPAAHHPMVDTG
ncbi:MULTISPECIES: response regulator transcription factor [Nocardia]|nr:MULTISPECIES: response regulator transcription factor [Nocardia]ASF09569.1 DNA-binding response regulator [Nocardia brasiliensis]MBF6126547.1 response regulator transcription factor [Nocardia brasiliensis]MBF6547064.1 response regulator transcription factor [Nocardia brasiliensis]